MSDLKSILTALRRPKTLVRAARIGVPDYDRERDLTRLISTSRTPSPETAVSRLVDQEASIEQTRRSGDASYSVVRHVEVLIALMAEAQSVLLPKAG